MGILLIISCVSLAVSLALWCANPVPDTHCKLKYGSDYKRSDLTLRERLHFDLMVISMLAAWVCILLLIIWKQVSP